MTLRIIVVQPAASATLTFRQTHAVEREAFEAVTVNDSAACTAANYDDVMCDINRVCADMIDGDCMWCVERGVDRDKTWGGGVSMSRVCENCLGRETDKPTFNYLTWYRETFGGGLDSFARESETQRRG